MSVKLPPIVWKPVTGFENYYIISNTGIIKSLHKKNVAKVLKTRIDRADYYTINLSKNGKSYTKFVHRLLAENFIPNPEGKKYVNHINGCQLDNNLWNLEWATHSENIIHAYQTGLCSKEKKQTPVIDICSNEEFKSIKEAARYYSIPYSTCKGYLNGRRKNITCLRYLEKFPAA
jgi:hypothetical protein